MRDQFIAFLEAPAKKTFLAIRSELVESDFYDPYSEEISQAEALLDQERWSEAEEQLQQGMPNLLLSPRMHMCAGFIYRQMGDEERAQMESSIAAVCIEGILTTGDGSDAQPYLVSRVEDEYDVLRYLSKDMKQQSLMESNGRTCDFIECTDGTEIWFDISDCYAKLAKRFEQ